MTLNKVDSLVPGSFVLFIFHLLTLRQVESVLLSHLRVELPKHSPRRKELEVDAYQKHSHPQLTLTGMTEFFFSPT